MRSAIGGVMIILPDSILATELREAFDELWIIDLEGDNLGARKTENVFIS
jgi:hypothetical protein